MKTTTFVVLLVILLAAPIHQFVFSQTASQKKTAAIVPPALSGTLSWLIGDWEGEGIQGGIAFISYLSVATLLDGTVLQVNRASSSGLKEMMLLGYDSASKKHVGMLYDSRNHIGLFSCELKGKDVSLDQIGLPQGFISKRMFQLLEDGKIFFYIERSEPGQAAAKSVEITFQKK